MRYFEDQSGEVFAVEEDGIQDHIIQPSWLEISEEAMKEKTKVVLSCDQAEILIDRAAGKSRRRFISSGEGILQEYQRAYEQAATFKEADYTGEPPSAVADNMRYKDLTAQDAADDIIAEGDQLNLVLDSIRSIRLDGKAAVQALQDSDDVAAVAQSYIDQLNEIKP